MTDREKYLTILDRFYRGRGGSLLTKDECEAMEYAISSIKTDLKYDLLYEETKHIADNDKMMDSTTKNDLGVDCISREFQEIVVEYPPNDLCTYPEYRGKPYFSIKYKEGNDCIIGYGTYNPKVFSRYLKDYFMPSVTPQEPKTGHWLRMSDLSEQDDYRYKCSRCGNVIHHKSKMDLYTFNSWCGRCGSDNGRHINYEVEE